MQQSPLIFPTIIHTHNAAFRLPISSTSLGTVLRVLNLTSVPGCALNIGAVSTVSCRWCFVLLPSLSLPSGHLGTGGISGTLSSSEYVVLCVMRNCCFRRCSSTRVDCWFTHELMVRKRGIDERDVMKLSRPSAGAAFTVSREGSCGVCGALELVQLKRLAMAPPRPGRCEMEGRFERNCRKVGGAGSADSWRGGST